MLRDQETGYNRSVTFRMTEENYKEIERIAQKSGVSVAWVLRYAVEQFLKSRPKQLKLL